MANPSPGLRNNPQHTITVTPYPKTVTVKFSDVIIASSTDALELKEADYPAVLYIPFNDIYFEHLIATDTASHCPFKGDASYWSVSAQGEAAKDVMWAYQEPYDEVAEIRDHGAFYPNRVTVDAA